MSQSFDFVSEEAVPHHLGYSFVPSFLVCEWSFLTSLPRADITFLGATPWMIDNRSWASETNYLFSCVDGFLLLLFSMAVHVCLKLVNCLVFGMFVSAQWWVQCTERGQDGVERWRNFQWCWELTSSNLSESEAERHTRCKKEFALATALWLGTCSLGTPGVCSSIPVSKISPSAVPRLP